MTLLLLSLYFPLTFTVQAPQSYFSLRENMSVLAKWFSEYIRVFIHQKSSELAFLFFYTAAHQGRALSVGGLNNVNLPRQIFYRGYLKVMFAVFHS